ncbi:MAG: WD40 repeat domain-containing protein, partial [Geobacter sp.]
MNLQQKPAKQRVCDTLTVAEVEQDAGHTTENLRLYRVIFGLYPYGIAVKSQEFVMPVRVQTKQLAIGIFCSLLFWLGAPASLSAATLEVAPRLGHTDFVNAVVFSPDGRYILSGSNDTTMRLWEVTTGKEYRIFKGFPSFVLAVAISPDGRYVAGAGRDTIIALWDVASGKHVKTLRGHTGSVHALAF